MLQISHQQTHLYLLKVQLASMPDSYIITLTFYFFKWAKVMRKSHYTVAVAGIPFDFLLRFTRHPNRTHQRAKSFMLIFHSQEFIVQSAISNLLLSCNQAKEKKNRKQIFLAFEYRIKDLGNFFGTDSQMWYSFFCCMWNSLFSHFVPLSNTFNTIFVWSYFILKKRIFKIYHMRRRNNPTKYTLHFTHAVAQHTWHLFTFNLFDDISICWFSNDFTPPVGLKNCCGQLILVIESLLSERITFHCIFIAQAIVVDHCIWNIIAYIYEVNRIVHFQS